MSAHVTQLSITAGVVRPQDSIVGAWCFAGSLGGELVMPNPTFDGVDAIVLIMPNSGIDAILGSGITKQAIVVNPISASIRGIYKAGPLWFVK
ncbi:hypothetical protein S7711_11360 [Stachybotrys chartarum IBT 7711]|uniref:Uncharacterized protein n=1 Tax=Stachybotrys chartarum (strain CBS 109288 / IBT 7711) TaxID=1280523 RepID=A0A084B7S5_STACB|nr:hypothetical protein S7711_11360 [Stachybotrys chartarum IBT 7711]KFA81182.1 hypothetical protein S40288_10551 [Stachybotrys chartarum IBT 40288]